MKRNLVPIDLIGIGVILIAMVAMAVAQDNMRSSPIKADQAVISNISVNVDSLGTARFDATGFRPFEMVELSVVSTPNMLPFDVVLARWTAIADQNGAFTAAWSGFAQPDLLLRAIGSKSQSLSEVRFSTVSITNAASANIDQCRNGSLDSANDCSADNWVNGNLNGSQAHFLEGDSVPYRIVFDGLNTAVEHNVTIQWDTTEGGKHAIDYLTTVDRTEPLANPCYGVPNCTPGAFSEFTIPPDPNVIAGFSGNNVSQIGGEFRLYGGTLLTTSGYTLLHDYTTTSHTSITIKFSTTVPNPVLTWGGHIATRNDWGVGNSAVAINGSPFHMRLLDLDGSGGNQDRGLSTDAVYYPGDITIIKDSQPDSVIFFEFTAVGPDVSNFSLNDDGVGTDTDYDVSFANLIRFGPAHSVLVTEGYNRTMWTTAINCVSDPKGGGGTNNNIISIPNQRVEIILEEGESVICTFVNTLRPTSAFAFVEGRVVDKYGKGLPRTHIQMTPSTAGVETFRAITSSLGYYRIEDIPTGRTYVLTITSKGYNFLPPSMIFDVNDDIAGMDFIGLETP